MGEYGAVRFRNLLVYTWYILLLIAACDFELCFSKTLSYTADGTWEKVDPSSEECKLHTCTQSSLAFKSTTTSMKLYNNETACDALVKKGIKKILFYGDSYVRHVYAAMLITLNGNYESGSMANPSAAPNCKYQTLFNEKHCNYFNLNHYGMVCNGQVFMDPILTGINDGNCKDETGNTTVSVVL
jgi:hypothetical protein